MIDLLFDPPWWMIVGLMLTGIVVFLQGNKWRETTVTRAGQGMMIATVILMIAGYLVDTPVEICTRQSRTLVKSVNERDWTTFESLLDPNVTFAMYANRSQLVPAAKDKVEKIELKNCWVTSLESTESTTGDVNVDLNVKSDQNITFGYTIPTAWRLAWTKTPKGWKLISVESLQSAQVGPKEIESFLSRH